MCDGERGRMSKLTVKRRMLAVFPLPGFGGLYADFLKLYTLTFYIHNLYVNKNLSDRMIVINSCPVF